MVQTRGVRSKVYLGREAAVGGCHSTIGPCVSVSASFGGAVYGVGIYQHCLRYSNGWVHTLKRGSLVYILYDTVPNFYLPFMLTLPSPLLYPPYPPFILSPCPSSPPPLPLPPFLLLPPPSPNALSTDRMTLLASCVTAHPVSIRLFGQEQLSGCRQHMVPLVQWLLRCWCPVYPSDHLGLVLDLDLETQSQDAVKRGEKGRGKKWLTHPFTASEWESRRPWQPYQGRSISVIVILRTLVVCATAVLLAWVTRTLLA
jgi:hypothetical protein